MYEDDYLTHDALEGAFLMSTRVAFCNFTENQGAKRLRIYEICNNLVKKTPSFITFRTVLRQTIVLRDDAGCAAVYLQIKKIIQIICL